MLPLFLVGKKMSKKLECGGKEIGNTIGILKIQNVLKTSIFEQKKFQNMLTFLLPNCPENSGIRAHCELQKFCHQLCVNLARSSSTKSATYDSSTPKSMEMAASSSAATEAILATIPAAVP